MKLCEVWDTACSLKIYVAFFPNSLATRLLATTALWMVAALFVTGLLLSTLFRQNAEHNFEDLLLAHAYNLMAAIELDASGQMVGEPKLGDPRFSIPQSGWSWAVLDANSTTTPLIHSSSLTGEGLDIPSPRDKPFDDQFRRSYQFASPDAPTVQRLEAQLYVGESTTLYQVMVAVNRGEFEADISAFNRQMFVFFTLFGLGTIIAMYFAIRVCLRPLNTAKRALGDVRDGNSETVAGHYPKEVIPLISEINGLIETNKSIIERARTQVGNLAHGLKTPLAVIANESRSKKGAAFRTIEEQSELMRIQIQTYLNRARIAAQKDVILARTDITPVIERLVRVMGKLSPETEFLVHAQGEIMFAGEEQDLEELLGNLLENAARHAQAKVSVSIGIVATNASDTMLEITIDDDGPGVSPAQREQIVKRGVRLDEKMPGSGLGLSIVNDIVGEYGGVFDLAENSWGGLSVVVKLPIVQTDESGQ